MRTDEDWKMYVPRSGSRVYVRYAMVYEVRGMDYCFGNGYKYLRMEMSSV